jgi:hypothetical protein
MIALALFAGLCIGFAVGLYVGLETKSTEQLWSEGMVPPHDWATPRLLDDEAGSLIDLDDYRSRSTTPAPINGRGA